MERARRGASATGSISLWRKRQLPGNPDSHETGRKAGLLVGWLGGRAAAVHAINPGNPESSRFNSHFERVPYLEAIKIVGVNGKALDSLRVAPGANDQAAASPDHAFHEVAADDGGGVISDFLGRIEPAVRDDGPGQNERKRDEAGVDALENLDFLVFAGASVQKNGKGKCDKKQKTKEDQHQVFFGLLFFVALALAVFLDRRARKHQENGK